MIGSSRTGSYDAADRLINAGYGYDTLGRTTTVPAADAHGSGSHASITGDLTVGYFANDLVAGQAQGGATVTFSLDPAQNRFAASSDGTTTTTSHFADGGDSPAWTSTGPTSWSRNLLGIGGDLAGTVDQAGAVVLNAVNLHGDIVATMPDTTTAAGVGSYFETTEYGTPRNAAAQPDTYGWLGGKRRSGNDLGGLTLMGVRLYNPGTGRFLSVDPVPGGTDNPYVYVTNPTDQYDLNGRYWSCWLGAARHLANPIFIYHQAIRLAAVQPYAVYYGGYRMNRWAARHSALRGLRPIGWAMQGLGMAGDVGIDYIKRHTGFDERVDDEHKPGSMNPFHRGNGGSTWLPGLYRRGRHLRLDWAW